MISGIYRERINDKEAYKFRIKYDGINGWQFRFTSHELAMTEHIHLDIIEEKTASVFELLKLKLEYAEMEPDLKILADQIGGIWTPDKLYDYFKILFLLSGPDDKEWFLFITMCRLVLHREIQDTRSPVICRFEEQFAFVEEQLEKDGRWMELAYVQVARDTGFRMHEMDFLNWEDVQYPRIMLRVSKTEKAVPFGMIREKTYATLQKLDCLSDRVFDNKGNCLRIKINRLFGNSFRFHDYHYCYQLKLMWKEIINPTSLEFKRDI